TYIQHTMSSSHLSHPASMYASPELGPMSFRTVVTNAGRSLISARSHATKRSEPGWAPSASSIADVSWGLSFRATAMTRYPAAVSRRAMPRPRPRLPPVTRTLRMLTHHLAGPRNTQEPHEADRGRHLVSRQRVARSEEHTS